MSTKNVLARKLIWVVNMVHVAKSNALAIGKDVQALNYVVSVKFCKDSTANFQ